MTLWCQRALRILTFQIMYGPGKSVNEKSPCVDFDFMGTLA